MASKTIDYGIKLTGANQVIADLKSIGATSSQLAKKQAELNAAGVKLDAKTIAKQYGVSQETVSKYLSPGGSPGGSGGDPGGIKGVKKLIGEDSAFGGTMKMLQGAGAVAGFAALANSLQNITEAALPLVEQYREGKVTFAQLSAAVAKSLPIFGAAWKAGENIRRMWDTDLANLEKDTKAGDVKTTATESLIKAIKEANKDRDAKHADSLAKQSLMGLVGEDLARAQEKAATAKERRGIEVQLKTVTGSEATSFIDSKVAAASDTLEKAGISKGTARYDQTIADVRQKAKQELEVKKAALQEQLTDLADTEAKQDKARQSEHIRVWSRYWAEEAAQGRQIQTASQREYMALLDNGFAAELQAMDEQGADKVRTLEKQLDDQLRVMGKQEPALRDLVEREGKRTIEAQKQANVFAIQAKVFDTLRSNQLDSLSALASAGDKAAGVERVRYETARRLTAEYQKLKAIIESTTATPEQKAEAQKQLQAIAGREQKLVGYQLKDQGKTLLQAQQQAGGWQGTQAGYQLSALGIKDDFAGSIAEAQMVLNNPNATPQQKAAAIAMLQGLQATTGKRMANTMEQAPAMPLVAAENSLTSLGIADAFRDSNDPQRKVLEITKEALDVQKETKDMLQKFLDANAPALQILANAVNR